MTRTVTSLASAPFTRRRFARLATAAPAVLLVGCGSILPAPGQPPQLYVLRAGGHPAADLPKVSQQLLIAVPGATTALDTERIALSRSPDTFDYFANAAWTDHAPVVVQAVLVESFEASGKAPAVARDLPSLRADYILISELRRFEAVYTADGGAPTVHAGLATRLVRMPDRVIIAEEAAERSAQAGENRMGPIVVAFGQALDALAQHVVGWTLRRIAADSASPGRRRPLPS